MSGLQHKIATSFILGVVDQPVLQQLRNASPAERRALLAGPFVSIYLGEEKVWGNMPTRALMAFSPELHATLTAKQATLAAGITRVALNPEQFTLPVLLKICDFIRGNCYSDTTFSLKPFSKTKESLELYRAGRLLGWTKDDYLRGLYFHLAKKVIVPSNPLGLDALDVIMKLGKDDPLFTHTAATYESIRFKNDMMPNVTLFSIWIAHHPDFQMAMDTCAKNNAAKFEARKAGRAAERKALAMKKAKAYEDRISEDNTYDWRAEAEKRNGLL